MSRALRLSPELATFPYDERAAEARVVQANLGPNPEVSLEVEDFGGNKEFSGFGESETTLKFSQLLELGGKRAARIQEAKAGKALVKFDYDAKRLEVLSNRTSFLRGPSDGPHGPFRALWMHPLEAQDPTGSIDQGEKHNKCPIHMAAFL